MFSASCNIRVDFPMPGSPPISVTEPVTSPPPSTRSSSWSLVLKRFSVEDTMVLTWLGTLLRCVEELVFQDGTLALLFSTISSTKVFH